MSVISGFERQPIQAFSNAFSEKDTLSRIAEAAKAMTVAITAHNPGGELQIATDQMISELDRKMAGRHYNDISAELRQAAKACPVFAGLLVSRLLEQVQTRAAIRSLPPGLLGEMLRQCERILASYAPGTEEAVRLASDCLGDDVFLKDLSICRLEAFAGVAQVIEQGAKIPVGDLLRGHPGNALRFGRMRASDRFRNGPYLENHTHTPMLEGFTPAGWDNCYDFAAQLLIARPDHLGVIGASWFYDPVLASISPRLRYLSEVPRAGGAHFFRFGSDQSDIVLATATSPTRRRLVETGLYRPTRYLMVWPRKALLAWAAKRAAGERHA